MVFVAQLFAAALLSGLASALPRPQDSAIGGEAAVSAPDGIPLTDTVELASQLSSTATAQPTQPTSVTGNYGAAPPAGNYGGGYGSGAYEGVASSANAWTSTSTAWSAYSTPVYGSGSSNWGPGYDDCVSQCVAKYGSPAVQYTPPTPTNGGDNSSPGSGVTHTVIVAPTQGVFRYVPFAVNASVGDTVKFMWGANNHTVTKGSSLTPCNKTSDSPFASGLQNKDFVFEQKVNTTEPVFFYCAAPTHCQKGMFGIINPPSAAGAPTSMSAMMQTITSQNPDVGAYAAYTKTQTANNLKVSNWGGSINLQQLPEWSHELVAENVLFTRNLLAQNPEVLKEDGAIDLSSATSTPLMIPQDVSALLSNSGASASSGTSANSSPSATTSDAAAPTGETENQIQGNGASSLASSRTFVALFVVVATFFVL